MSTQIRIRWIVGLCVLLALVAIVWIARGSADSRPPQRKIALMSSIALQWGEGDLGSVLRENAGPDPLVARLAMQGEIEFVDSIAGLQAAQPDIAILIQPRALAPDELARLDNWVRAGGRLLLFADPALQWPSDLPLGDPRRPLFTSMLSPILAHWGLELALPMDETEVTIEVAYQGSKLAMVSPGIWSVAGKAGADGNCRIDRVQHFAECRPGKGQAVLIADADMLNSELWQSSVPNVDSNDNLAWVGRTIEALAAGTPVVGRGGK